MTRETDALAAAARLANTLDPAIDAAKAASQPLIHGETELLRAALCLQFAGAWIGLGPTVSEEQRNAFSGLAALQRELMLDGWDSLLCGRYAAAMQPARVLDELSVFIVAAAVSREEAAHVLTKPDKDWKINKAADAIRSDAERRGQLAQYENWQQGRVAHRKQLHPLAHTGGILMNLALRHRNGTLEVPFGPDVEVDQLRRIALYYMLLAHEMVLAIGCACQDQLDPAGPWREQQAGFLARWEVYSDQRRREMGL